MHPKKIFLITLLLIIPLILSGCNFAFAPGGGSGKAIGAKGVYKSGNKGENWIEQNALEDNENNLNRFNVHKLAFDIFDSNILYRASNVGFFISENGGDSWRQISSSFVNDFVLNPKTRGIIYIASNNQVYKTTDNGENWELLYTEARPNVTISSLAISYFDTSRIYILTSEGTLILSIDWGISWKTIHNFETQNAKQLLIDPHNSQNMYAGFNNALYYSADEGKNWQEIIRDKIENYPSIDQYKQLFFTPNSNHLIYLSKYGILKSSDKGASWQVIRLITSPNAVDIHTLNLNPENIDEIYYTVGNILYHTIDSGRNWKTKVLPVPGGAKASQLLIDPNDENILYLGVTQ